MPKGLLLILVIALLGMNSTLSWGGELDKAQAKTHFETATRYYDVQEYEKAIAEYKAGYLAKPDPAFLFNIGQCYRKVGNTEKAQEFLKLFLNKAEPDDPNRANVEARIRDLETDEMFKEDLRRGETRTTIKTISAKPVEGSIADPDDSEEKSSFSKRSSPFVTESNSEIPRFQVIVPAELATIPIYKTWWFWTGVGAVAVGAVVTAVLLSSGNESKIPSTSLGSQGAF
jgi:tetratricopeptide (TPR) repeat protein